MFVGLFNMFGLLWLITVLLPISNFFDTQTEHLNQIDETNSSKFTHEEEKDKSMPFLDTLIVRKKDDSVQLLIYRKATHTDQYLSFKSHHPLYHKLSVVKTLLDRCLTLVTEEEDTIQEEKHIRQALQKCGYLKWSLDRVKEEMKNKKETNRI